MPINLVTPEWLQFPALCAKPRGNADISASRDSRPGFVISSMVHLQWKYSAIYRSFVCNNKSETIQTVMSSKIGWWLYKLSKYIDIILLFHIFTYFICIFYFTYFYFYFTYLTISTINCYIIDIRMTIVKQPHSANDAIFNVICTKQQSIHKRKYS